MSKRQPNSKIVKIAAKNKGVTLIEMMLVLAIMTIIILSATKYYTTTRDSVRVNQAVTVISNIVNASYTWVEGQFDFGGLASIQTLIDAKLLPNNYNYNPTSGIISVNPWGGKVDVNVNPSSSSQFIVALDNVPYAQCNLLQAKVTTIGGYTSASSCPKSGTTTFSAIFSEQN